MRPAKGESSEKVETGKIELQIDKKIIEQLFVMEKHSKISKEELVTIALKRFISQHKDYFPDDYKG